MADMEIEEVSFLSGEEQDDKRSKYEPNNAERCKQIICTQRWAVLIAVSCAALILTIAVIAALTRTPCLNNVTDILSHNDLRTTTERPQSGGKDIVDEDFPWKDIRLPKSVKPISYDIYMHPNLTSQKYTGVVTISVRVVEKSDFLVLHHAKEINLEQISAFLSPTSVKIPIEKTMYSPVSEQVYVEFSAHLESGTLIDLKLTFNSVLSKGMSGFYISKYKTAKGETRYLATTHFEPADARRAFPCFDEPAMKAKFKLTIVREKHHITLFNMPKLKTTAYTGNPDYSDLMVDHFNESVTMSTYLVAFVVCDFLHIQDKTKRGITVSVYAPPDMISQAKLARSAAVKILDYYEHYFKISYPLPKLDLIAIPDFDAGAMENWGLITYRMTSILYDPLVSSTWNKQMITVTIAHELAHQWFGNLVTMDWWNDLWLNEGFASYVEYIGADVVNPDLKMKEQFITESLLRAFRLDASSQSHPIEALVHDPGQIFSLFDAVSYDKGSSILRMLANYMGNITFSQGLTKYLNQHKMGNAKTSDLWTALTDASSGQINVTSLMDTWTRQMGYPVVTVHKQGQTINLHQSRFLLNMKDKSSPASPFNYTWKIPLTYITDTIRDPLKENLFSKSGSFQLPKPSEWIKMNTQGMGFYRVNYHPDNWAELNQLLMTSYSSLTPADRACLLDDAFALSRAGLLNTSIAMNLTQYLTHERDYIPWKAVLHHLSYIDELTRNTPTNAKFRKYVLWLVKPVIKDLGLKDVGSPLQKYLRVILMRTAGDMEDPETIQYSIKLFSQWMYNGTRLSPNLKSLIYSTGLAHGGQKEFDFCYNKMTISLVPSEKRSMLGALSSVRDANLIQKLLSMCKDSDKISTQAAPTLIRWLGSNPAATVITWQFTQKNWEYLFKKYGAASFSFRGLFSIPGSFSDEYDLQQVEAFFQNHKVAKSAEARLTVDEIRTNIQWRKLHEKEISNWLDANPVETKPKPTHV